MSRRLEIELTSRRDDGAWTWRAAGARQPKGELSPDLLPESATVGTVLKAEAEIGLDGLEIVAVAAPKVREPAEGLLPLITRRSQPLVTTALTAGGRARLQDDGLDGKGSKRENRRSQKNRREGDSDDRRRKRDQRTNSRFDDEEGDRRDTKRNRSGVTTKSSRDRVRDRDRDQGRTAAAQGLPSDSDAGQDTRPDRKASGQSRDRDRNRNRDRGRDRNRDRDRGHDDRPFRARPKTTTLRTKNVHRQAVLGALPEEQRLLAREVLSGGVPGVRKSIERMNAKAAAAKMPEIKAQPLIALAEALSPILKAAEWHDRADAALVGIAEIDLRDLRSIVVAADRSTRDDETRALAEKLRSGLTHRLEVDHRKWLDDLARTIHEGRTVRALKLSSHPPKAGTPLPPDIAERLAGIASADLSPDTSQHRWAVVTDAVAVSPVRTQVKPAGVPRKPTEDLLGTIRRLKDRVPQIAVLFDLGTAKQDTEEPKAAGAPEDTPKQAR